MRYFCPCGKHYVSGMTHNLFYLPCPNCNGKAENFMDEETYRKYQQRLEKTTRKGNPKK